VSTIIGIDVGRSSTKVVCYAQGERVQLDFESAVSPAIELSTESAAHMAEPDTVLLRGKSFFTGRTAIVQTGDDMLAGLSDDWSRTDKHFALILGALKRLKCLGVATEGATVVVGLPARLFASQKKLYGSDVAALLVGNQIRVVPQPMGPFFNLYFNEFGGNDSALDLKSLAFIEVGQYTTDFALVDRGVVVEKSFGSCMGMSDCAAELVRLIQDRYRIAVSLVEATALFASPTLLNFGKELSVAEEVRLAALPLAGQIIDKAAQLFGDRLRLMHGIHIAGGGAPLVYSELVKAWSADGFVTMAEQPRYAVAEGFARFGLGFSKG
jgi:plasmid segregation protein ParM